MDLSATRLARLGALAMSIAMAIGLLMTAPSSNATLVGDVVTVQYRFPNAQNEEAQRSLTPTVLAGPTEISNWPGAGTGPFAFTDINIEGSSISMELGDFFSFGNHIELSFRGLDFLDDAGSPIPGAFLSGVSVTSDFFPATRLWFTDDSIRLDLTFLRVEPNSFIHLGLQVVPEPSTALLTATALLTGLGLVGLGARPRRKPQS